MKAILVLLSLIGLYQPVQAQNMIGNQDPALVQLFCSAVPADFRELCLRQLGGTEMRDQVIQYCNTLDFSFSKEACYTEALKGVYSPAGIKFCKNSEFSFDQNKIDCLKVIRNKYLNSDALKVCSAMSFDHEKSECVKVISNREYSQVELRSCANNSFGFQVMSCLKQLGYALPNINMNSDSVSTWSLPRTSTPKCEVSNSSSYLGSIDADQFIDYAIGQAQDNRNCVVTSVYNQTRSRALISPNGRILGQELTEKETTDLKRSYGFERCQVLICK